MSGRFLGKNIRFSPFHPLFLISILSVATAWPQSSKDDPKLYAEQIRPILAKNCLMCHGPSIKQAGLDLSNRDALLRGGDDGPVVVPGDSNASRLYKLVAHQAEPAMPYKGNKLSDDEIAKIGAWIQAGVPFDGPVASQAGASAPVETHWAFRKPLRPTIPAVKNAAWVRNPIDAFILAAQETRGLTAAPEADPRVLLRRVYLDLIGLPPTPAEIHAFLSDPSKSAYDKVVDRLLASPRYGERWGRHWMDIWRYSDWYGNRKSEDLRNSQRHIWRWRDWIVDSRMIVEMLAGDELAPDDPKVLAATGYLARSYFLKNRNTWLQDVVEYSSGAFLGLTLKCARCHSHKYDPIPQTDYYRFRAFFEPYDVRVDRVAGEVDVLKNGLVHSYDADSTTPTYRFVRGSEQSPDTANPLKPGVPSLFGNIELKIEPVALPFDAYYPDSRKFVEQDLVADARSGIVTANAELKTAIEVLAKLDSTGNSPASGKAARANGIVEASGSGNAKPAGNDPEHSEPATRPQAENAVQLARKKLAAAQAYLPALEARIAAEHAAHNSAPAKEVEELTADAGKLEREANTLKAEENLLRAQLDLEAAKGPNLKEADKKEADKKLAAAKEQVKLALDSLSEPGGDSGQPFTPIGKQYPTSSTGRRLALARWIASGDNPLTARVGINDIWLRHFGTALVPTVTNFGKSGQSPTHPELLDWLATEFVRQGWSMKAIHRLIVTSSTYRMASTSEKAQAANAAIDPGNRYLWHMNSRRVEAEVVRDSLLYVAGKLDLTMGGPDLDDTKGEEIYRRSIYFRDSLSGQVQFLKIFDLANPSECFERTTSIVPQESLALANSKLSLVAARLLAGQVSAQVGQTKDGSSRFVNAVFEAILGRLPLPDELIDCQKYLVDQAALYRTKSTLKAFHSGPVPDALPSADPDQRARESLAHVLFNHNDFITIR
jgi:mono/diheme cytochrome c family protein